VQVTVKSGWRTVSTRSAAVGAKCTFTSTVRFKRDPKRVTVTARFLGNAALRPTSASVIVK
jgi:hypothetical protein